MHAYSFKFRIFISKNKKNWVYSKFNHLESKSNEKTNKIHTYLKKKKVKV